MNNEEVIKQLDLTISELVRRRQEVDEILDRPMTPEEFPDVEKQVVASMNDLSRRIRNLRTQRADRKLLADLKETVVPLSAEQVAAIRRALEQVSRSIAAVENIQTALAVAAAIARSASSMSAATDPTTA